MPPNFKGKYHKYASSSSQDLLFTSTRDNLNLPPAAALYFWDIHTQTKLTSSSQKQQNWCVYGCRDSSHRSLPSGRAWPSPDTAALLPLHALVFHVAYVLLTHKFRSCITWLCTLPRVIDCIMAPQNAYILIAGTHECYFIWQKSLRRCD